jgi:hypothetical protein
MTDPALPPGFEEEEPLPPGFEEETPRVAAPQAFRQIGRTPTGEAISIPGQEATPQGGAAKPAPNRPLLHKIYGLIEAGTSLATSIVGGPLGMAGGLVGGVAGGGTPKEIEESMLEGARKLTYEPKYPAGGEYLTAAAETIEPVARQLGPAAGLVNQMGNLGRIASQGAREVRGIGAAAADANRQFNASRGVATEAKAAKKAALEAPVREGIQAARDAGYVLTPQQAKGGVVSRTTASLAGEPRLEKLASQKNAEVTNKLIREDLGLGEDIPITREAVAARRKEAHEPYERIKKVGKIENDDQYMKDLDKIVESYDTAAESFAHRSDNPFKKTLEGLRQKTVTAASAIEEVKLLRNDADKAYRAGDKALGKAYKAAAEALDNSMDRHLTKLSKTVNGVPELKQAVADYREARKTIAKTYVADKALNDATGNVDAAVYARELKKGAKLDGNALTVAKAAQQFEKSMQRAEKTGGTGPTYADLLAATVSKEALALGARPAARSLLLTETVQNRMAPKSKPKAPTPEPELTAEQAPFPSSGGAEPPRSPLGDVTPDWETAPGAAEARRLEVVPEEGPVAAVDEAPGPQRVLPGGADTRARSNESPAGPVEPGMVAEPPVPTRRAGEQIPAVPGRPDLPDTMMAEGPEGITPATSGDPRAPDASYANRVQRGLEVQGDKPVEQIPVGEATEVPDPRLADIEALKAEATSPAVKKALEAEATKVKKDIKTEQETAQRKADADELRTLAGKTKDAALKERLLTRAQKLEADEKIPVGETIEGQPEIKPEKGERSAKPIPTGEATEVPNEPATGRAPEIEKLPTGEAKHVTDSGVEEAIPTGEAKELFVPPEKAPTKVDLEVRIEKTPRGEVHGYDKKGDPYTMKVSEQRLGADKKERSILVEAHDPVSGQRRGFVDFAIRKDGTLVAENVKVAPYLKKRGIAELLYRAARDAGHDIAPGRVQTDEGLALVEALQRKGVINKEADGPRAKASDLLKGEGDATREVSKQEGVQQERGKGNEGGQAAEAGGGNRVQREAPGGEAKAEVTTWTGKYKKGMTAAGAKEQLAAKVKEQPGLEWKIVPAPELGKDRFKLEGRKK